MQRGQNKRGAYAPSGDTRGTQNGANAFSPRSERGRATGAQPPRLGENREQEQPRGGQARTMAGMPVRRCTRGGRFFKLALLMVLVLGLAGLALLLLPDLGIEQTMQAYPLKYRELIDANAREQGLEPAYVAGVILAESSFNPDAVSSVNAQGLMQILPSTAEWIAGKFGERYVEGSLYDPATNIRYGCWYLGFLMRRYGNDKRCSSAAYHSGQGTVDGWLKNPAYSSDGRTLDVIAGKNADTYVKRVLEYYEGYEKIYARE